LLVWSGAGLGQSAPQPAPIPLHTPVVIELEESISSESVHAGQEISFKVLRDVVTEGRTVISEGTPVAGTVQAVHSSGAFRQAGWFELRLKTARATDGSVVSMEFPRPKIRSTKGEKTLAGAAAVPVLLYYFPFIPFAVAANSKKGAAYTVRAGERYLVYVAPAEAPALKEMSEGSSAAEKPAVSQPR
jgi:hypothetical protein